MTSDQASSTGFVRVHGGPDQYGVPLFDFSTNSNACGPCPSALAAVMQADATQYPDASYTALRRQLAAFHGIDAQRVVVLAASASEFIFPITLPIGLATYAMTSHLPEAGRDLLPSEDQIVARLAAGRQEE